ncbi:hypothetical protein HUJ04_010041 [Dendroctonus ponderosae]|nr:hypothetical protein HUJ04_010041 [Dendroctonus ponderosae]
MPAEGSREIFMGFAEEEHLRELPRQTALMGRRSRSKSPFGPGRRQDKERDRERERDKERHRRKRLEIDREKGIGKGDVIPMKDDVCHVQGADPVRVPLGGKAGFLPTDPK